MVGSDHVEKIRSALITEGETGAVAIVAEISDDIASTRNWNVLWFLAYRRHDVTMMAQKRTGPAV
jgi:hypothetical protein